MTTILLIRHGETVWNLEGRVQGHGDSPLSTLGQAQAHALADRLISERVNAIYSSDLPRTLATIEPYASRVGIPVQTTPDLREKCFGEWEGLTSGDLETRYPELWHRYHTLRDIDTPVPGGESWEQVAARTVGLLKTVIARHDANETVVIVGHGGALRPMILHSLRAPLTSLTRISVDNAGISTLRFKEPDDGRVVSLNDCRHLEVLK